MNLKAAFGSGTWKKLAARVRTRPVPEGAPPTGGRSFEDLFKAEYDWRLRNGDPEAVKVEAELNANEDAQADDLPFSFAAAGSAEAPRVSFIKEDCVGLAFSGGGIRSATFNLGLLQGLHRLDLLRHIDYLATVSGGGYIGAWWSAWLSRKGRAGDSAILFPTPDEAGRPAEAKEIRHLREFSNFLAPRIGFFETETWAAVLAIFTAMVPTLILALAIIAAGLVLWLLASLCLLPPPQGMFGRGGGLLVALGILLGVQWGFERRWKSGGRAETAGPVQKRAVETWWRGAVGFGILATAVAWWLIQQRGWLHSTPQVGTATRHLALGLAWGDGQPFAFDWHLFHAPLAWAGAVLVLLVPRVLVLRLRTFRSGPFREKVAAGDRMLQRMLAAAVVWSLGGALWLLGAYVHHRDWSLGPAAGAAASGGLFALLRNWFVGQLSSQKKGGIGDALKPLLPQLLALLTVTLAVVCTAAGLAGVLEWSHQPDRHWHVGEQVWPALWILLALASAVIGSAAAFLDPAMVSMHSFYRNRLARAYLGASNPGDQNPDRFIDVREQDEVAMRDLRPRHRGARCGPLHLVCCAANDVGGDQLGNLARASRSAVLSPLGFQINDDWRPWTQTRTDAEKAALEAKPPTHIDRLTLSSAITASAAAFNSNMGSLSSQLGTLVCFLMSALNLRLGLWLPHPRSSVEDLGHFPGALLLREMFGSTFSGIKNGQPVSKYVHLSDGAHFENLALYELIRRHCRYIIVSDCGADADVAFDDFGNAQRRIREDFGVEIDIDLSPLRPDAANAFSRQHVAVGTINYDLEKGDTGILLYFKPTLTGDEPGDVTQYRKRNKAFPHESTGDQFYDEAQWESYRRLGEHALNVALQFLNRRRGREPSAAAVFSAARSEWYQGPTDLPERVARASERVAELESEFRASSVSEAFLREVFPELTKIAGLNGAPKPAGANGAAGGAAPPDPHQGANDLVKDLPCVLKMCRAMEYVWLTCQLDTFWNHPLNLSWMNLFQRWVYTPTFRLWWPLIRPQFGAGFRRFLEEHLDLRDDDHPPTEITIGSRALASLPGDGGYAETFWVRSRTLSDRLPAVKGASVAWVYPCIMTLRWARDGAVPEETFPIQAGLAAVTIDGDWAEWKSADFYVPPGLWGSGVGRKFLCRLLDALKKDGVQHCRVQLGKGALPAGAVAAGTCARSREDQTARQAQNDDIAFYKSAGFSPESAQTASMVLQIPEADTEVSDSIQ